MNEKEQKKLYAIVEIGTTGYGEGKISYENYTSSAEYDSEIEARFFEIIRQLEALVDINDTDDGCIDGRYTVELYVNTKGDFELVLADNSNHERAKVAGGGYTTGLAMRLGSIGHGANVEDDLVETIETFDENGVHCGAHSAAQHHAHDEEYTGEGKPEIPTTGCGANDEFPVIINNAIAYCDEIKKSMEGLLGTVGMKFDNDMFESVIANWEAVMADQEYFSGSTGASRLRIILNLLAEKSIKAGGRKPVGVAKNLEGDHKEIAIVINFAEGKTVSQGLMAQKLAETLAEKQAVDVEEVDKAMLPQSFVIDAWRIINLSEALFDKDTSNDEDVARALYAGVMYQLATAATLTNGSLPITVYKPE